MDTFAKLIARWESIGAFADDVGVPYGTAQMWKFRNSIHPRHWTDVVKAARMRGFDDVSLEKLTEMSRRRDRRRRRGPLGEGVAA